MTTRKLVSARYYSTGVAAGWTGAPAGGLAQSSSYDTHLLHPEAAYNMENDTKVKLELYRDLTEGVNGGQWEASGRRGRSCVYTECTGWSSVKAMLDVIRRPWYTGHTMLTVA